MFVITGFLAAAVIGVASVLVLARGGGLCREKHPWNLYEAAWAHVQLLGGLAGFAFTGIILIVSFAMERGAPTDPALDTVVVMFLVAFLWWIGGAFLISFIPHDEARTELMPRVHFSLATTLEYRTVFLSWFALVPLLEANGLARLTPIVDFTLLGSLACGSVLVAMVADGLGVIRFRETYVSAAVAIALTLAYGVVAHFAAPQDQASYAALNTGLIIFALNGLGFAIACLTPLGSRHPGVTDFFERHGRQIVVADMQLTMLSLSFLCLVVVKPF
jgi:uncharacterized membrane protein YesL